MKLWWSFATNIGLASTFRSFPNFIVLELVGTTRFFFNQTARKLVSVVSVYGLAMVLEDIT
jgi:hypothetical protein